MLFILEKELFIRRFMLAAFILAMLGPWSFDLISVPVQFPCGGPLQGAMYGLTEDEIRIVES